MTGEEKRVVAYGLIGAALGWALSRPKKGVGVGPGIFGDYPYPPPIDRGVEFARGGARPVFPVQSSSNRRFGQVAYKDVNGQWHGNMARAFKASRGGRYHVGIDLYADPGDVVVAPESGTIVGRQTFYAGTGAMLIATDSGVVVLLGETKMGGADEFGLTEGSRVTAGQPVSRVGLSNSGSHMLHVETYRPGTTTNHSWYRSSAMPSEVLDPTDYFLRAKAHLEGAALA